MRGIWARIGLALLLLAGALAVAHLLSLLTGASRPVTPESLWHALDPGSLVGLRGVVEQRLDPMLWPPLHLLLSLPGWLILAPLGLLLLLTGRGRRRAFD